MQLAANNNHRRRRRRPATTQLEAALAAAAKVLEDEVRNAKRTVNAIQLATNGSLATPRQAALEAGVIILQAIQKGLEAAEVAARGAAEDGL
jgi:hypothetical protein